ncbi:class I SAM-dependent rRNA methyltransferase [Hydrocarboniphaga effusa]|uniref:class I SAM-dependent rRNA methyltransferase n=1 Tax=Hydrocarboniphaga effusa TaxID=243629 RepID=UPI00313807CB
MLTLKLKTREDRRLRAGHLWVYSNEIDTATTAAKGVAPGTLCKFVDSRDKPLGVGYVNPTALLCGRLLTGKADAVIDADWMLRRLQSALALREKLYPTPYYRLAFGDSDGLPGLVVDRYGDVLVVQLTTAGMENLKAIVIEALQRLLKPRGILLRNDTSARELEGLSLYEEIIGEVPETVDLIESGVPFKAPVRGGQKTGWFYDQHANRDRLAPYVKGARVLDVFSYVGGWAVRAAKFGASEVTCVDSSKLALEVAAENAKLNGIALETRQGDALDVLKTLRGEGRQFDVVVVDPPALIKRKRDTDAGTEHYAALNRQAMHLLAPDGILISCSCSFHMEAAELQRILLRESRTVGRRLQILEQGGQSPDHPVHPAIVETRYLKAFYCRLA